MPREYIHLSKYQVPLSFARFGTFLFSWFPRNVVHQGFKGFPVLWTQNSDLFWSGMLIPPRGLKLPWHDSGSFWARLGPAVPKNLQSFFCYLRGSQDLSGAQR